VATTGGKIGGQTNERERENKDAPESLPAYDPDSLITHNNALSTQERDDLVDRIMSGVRSSRRTARICGDRTIAYSVK